MQDSGLDVDRLRTAGGKAGTVSDDCLMAPSPSGVPSQVPLGLFSKMLSGLPSEMAPQMPSHVPPGQATPFPTSQTSEAQPYGQGKPDQLLSLPARDLQQPALRAKAGQEGAGAAMHGAIKLTERTSMDVDQWQVSSSLIPPPPPPTPLTTV